jgi:hypothetical protein
MSTDEDLKADLADAAAQEDWTTALIVVARLAGFEAIHVYTPGRLPGQDADVEAVTFARDAEMLQLLFRDSVFAREGFPDEH